MRLRKIFNKYVFLMIAFVLLFSRNLFLNSAEVANGEGVGVKYEKTPLNIATKVRERRALNLSYRRYEEAIASLPSCRTDIPVYYETDNRRELWDEERKLFRKLSAIANSFCKNLPVNTFINQLQPTGEFADLDYKTDKDVLRTHAFRLCSLVREEIRGPMLSANVLASFKWLTCVASPPPEKNWWQHAIGTPSSIWNPVFLAQRHLPRQLVVDYLKRWFEYGEEGAVWNPVLVDGSTAGANLGSRMFLGTIHAFMNRNLGDFVAEAEAALENEIVERKGFLKNGIRPDGCLHQHSKILEISSTEKRVLSQPHISNYGKEFYRMVSRTMTLLHLTSKPQRFFSPDIERALVDRFFDCQMLFHRGKIAEPSTAGRFIDSGYIITRLSAYQGIYQTARHLSKLRYRQEELRAAIRRYNSAVPSETDALRVNKFLHSSDIMVHHRRDFFASVHFMSTRTFRAETFKTQNALGYYQGDGWFSLLVSTTEYGQEGSEVFQVYDWTKIPGVTCEQVQRQVYFYDKNLHHFFNNGSIAGGVSNGSVGLAAFLLDRPTTRLKAKKTWVFFSDSVVSLGSDIVVETNEVIASEPVATTINQVLAADSFTVSHAQGEDTVSFSDNSNATYDAKWIHHDQTGYVFPDLPTPVTIETDTRTTSNGRDVKLFTAYIDHGLLYSTPGSYSFIYLPSASEAKTRQFSHDNPIQVVHQTALVHAVCHQKDQAMGIALWQPTCADMSPCLPLPGLQVCSDAPTLLMVTLVQHSDPPCVDISVADPRQALSEVTLGVRFSMVMGSQTRTIVLPSGGQKGASVSSRFCSTFLDLLLFSAWV